jgi:hypothetical protein
MSAPELLPARLPPCRPAGEGQAHRQQLVATTLQLASQQLAGPAAPEDLLQLLVHLRSSHPTELAAADVLALVHPGSWGQPDSLCDEPQQQLEQLQQVLQQQVLAAVLGARLALSARGLERPGAGQAEAEESEPEAAQRVLGQVLGRCCLGGMAPAAGLLQVRRQLGRRWPWRSLLLLLLLLLLCTCAAGAAAMGGRGGCWVGRCCLSTHAAAPLLAAWLAGSG